jgi:hypothetical protein
MTNTQLLTIEHAAAAERMRDVLRWAHLPHAAEHADRVLIKSVERAMLYKLAIAREMGRGDWWRNDPKIDAALRESLAALVAKGDKGDMVDVMNIAGMIYMRAAAGLARQSSAGNT